MPHLKAIIVHILIGLTDITFGHMYITMLICVLLFRGPYVRSVYVLNMSSFLNKDIIIIIIIIIIIKTDLNIWKHILMLWREQVFPPQHH